MLSVESQKHWGWRSTPPITNPTGAGAYHAGEIIGGMLGG
jgi:hypothetical protein